MLSYLKFELRRFFRGHWPHFLLAVPGGVLWTILHEGAHALAITFQGGQVTKFVWIPTFVRWGYVEYNLPDHPFSNFAVSFAPYGFWLILALMAGVLSLRARPYSYWAAGTLFIWMFVMPLGDIAMAAFSYLFGSSNDFSDAFGSPTGWVTMLIVLFGMTSVGFGMIIQQRLYREQALSVMGYTLLAMVGLALIGTLHFIKMYWS